MCLLNRNLTLWSLLIIISASSCKVWNPNQMFRNVESVDLAQFAAQDRVEYKIARGDMLQVQVFTNEGYKLVDAGLAGSAQINQFPTMLFLVDQQGYARLPLVDTVALAGLNVLEAARVLEEKYEASVVDPFVQVSVTNRRAFVYRGDGEATVVTMPFENMTIMEVLATSGGIPATAKAYQVKLIRGTGENQSILNIDLRKPENVELGYTIVRANDILIIDPTFETTLLQQLTPVFAFITSAIAIYGIFTSLNQN